MQAMSDGDLTAQARELKALYLHAYITPRDTAQAQLAEVQRAMEQDAKQDRRCSHRGGDTATRHGLSSERSCGSRV